MLIYLKSMYSNSVLKTLFETKLIETVDMSTPNKTLVCPWGVSLPQCQLGKATNVAIMTMILLECHRIIFRFHNWIIVYYYYKISILHNCAYNPPLDNSGKNDQIRRK